MTIGNGSGKHGTIRMKKNQEYISYAWSGQTRGWDQGGQTTVVRMTVGDVMSVEGDGSVSGNYEVYQKHSSFTGVLINNC